MVKLKSKSKRFKMAAKHPEKKREEKREGGEEKQEEGEERYTFFWRSASPFSQWFACKFTVEGTLYNCAEQYMMHQKAVMFGDDKMAEAILKTDDPKKQKSFGRKVSNFDPDEWTAKCRDIVKQGNYAKFTQNKKLRKALLETSGTVLVEASPVDTIWGIGLAADHPRARTRDTWRGSNWLGFALTDFSQNAALYVHLAATRGTVLVEASPRDRLWGIGLGANNPKAQNKATWRGRNWLGYALTEVRDRLLAEREGTGGTGKTQPDTGTKHELNKTEEKTGGGSSGTKNKTSGSKQHARKEKGSEEEEGDVKGSTEKSEGAGKRRKGSHLKRKSLTEASEKSEKLVKQSTD